MSVNTTPKKIVRKRVVVTGMGILSSIGITIPEFKKNLFDKVCGIKSSEKYLGCFTDANASEILQPLVYPGLAPELINSLDKTALWTYKVGFEALAQANIHDDKLREKTSLILGICSSGTEAYMPMIEDKYDDFSLEKLLYCGTYASPSAIASSLLKLKGGFEVVATACTASPNAIGIAYDQIQNGKNPLSLVVGSEPLYLPTFAGFYALGAMKHSPTSPFSGTPGMSIGEGAGALVLEEYEHALARGATIYGEIVAYATSTDAHHDTAPDPRGDGAAQVMQSALMNAQITTEDIDYINAHGTGTEANDRCETLAMKKVFANIKAIPISSTKAYFGHNIGSAGIVELIACFVTLAEDKIPPTLNFTEARPNCDLNYVPNEFLDAKVGLFMKNNYAFGGNNSSIIASVRPEVSPASSYEPKRVAITGSGAITALGNDLQSTLEGVWSQQKAGISIPLMQDEESKGKLRKLLDVLENNPKLSAYITERFSQEKINQLFDKKMWMNKIIDLDPRKYLRRFDPRNSNAIDIYALIAMTQAMKSAGRKIKRDGHNLGMILGMSKGPQVTLERYMESLMPDPTKVRTSEFPGALMNASATYCSISEGIKGYNTTLATGVNAAFGALAYGYEIIRQDLQPQVIVGGADADMKKFSVYLQTLDEESQLLEDPAQFTVYSQQGSGHFLGEGSAMLFLEDYQAAQDRGATIQAEVLGYGKSNDGSYFDKHNIADRCRAQVRAIEQALAEAGITPEQVDLVCGTSNGSRVSGGAEVEAIRQVFAASHPQVPVVNYNAHFGLVESCVGMLNMSVVLEIMKRGEIPPIPNTTDFCTDEIAFVKQFMKKEVNIALVLGSTEGGGYYAFLLRNEK